MSKTNDGRMLLEFWLVVNSLYTQAPASVFVVVVYNIIFQTLKKILFFTTKMRFILIFHIEH